MKRYIPRGLIGRVGKNLDLVVSRLDKRVTVFNFHDVGDNPSEFVLDNGIHVTNYLFRNQIDFVASNFNIISMDQFLKGDIPTRPALITFDDGYDNTFQNGVRLLESLRLPCTVFLNMGPIHGENYWAEKISYLHKYGEGFAEFLSDCVGRAIDNPHLDCTKEIIEQYERLYLNNYESNLSQYMSRYVTPDYLKHLDNPLVTLGSHLYTHYNVKHLSNTVLELEYRKNEEAMSQLKYYTPVFAFPFGDPRTCFTAQQASLILQFGARRVFTSRSRPNDNHDAKVIDRISLTHWHDSESRMWYQTIRVPLSELVGVRS